MSHKLPYNWTWEHLKDTIREALSSVNGQPQWTEVSYNQQNESTGWFRLRSDRDAKAAFGMRYAGSQAVTSAANLRADYFANEDIHGLYGRRLLLHDFDISGTSPRLVNCNCIAVLRTAGHSDHSSGLHTGLVSHVQSYGVNLDAYQRQPLAVAHGMPDQYPGSGPVSANTFRPEHGTYPFGYGAGCEYRSPEPMVNHTLHAGGYVQAPTYICSGTGLPVNVSQGAVRQEHRGVFIRGLRYSVTDKDLSSFIAPIATYLHLEVNRDKTGKSKGTATALFASYEAANRVVVFCDGREYMGRTLEARLDKETTTVDPSRPPVVNGATASAVCSTRVPKG